MNTKQNFFIALISLMTILACAFPGQPSASAPAPTVDTAKLETMVADTVSTALTQTQQAVPQPLPTFTPDPTVTSASSTTDAGSTLAEQDNGSMLFTDERAGYYINIPDGWLAVRVNQQEYFDAWSLAEAADPRIQQSLLSIQNQDPNQYRLYAFDTQDGHLVNDIVTNMLFIWSENDTMSFESEEDLQKLADGLPATQKGLKIISSSLVILPSGTTVGIIESDTQTKNSSGLEVTIYQKQVFFKATKGVQDIVLTTDSTLKDTDLPVFDSMIETITLLK